MPRSRDRGICESDGPSGALGTGNQLESFLSKDMTCVSIAPGSETKSRWVRGRRSQCFIGKGKLVYMLPTYKLISQRQDSLSERTLADIDWWQALNDQRILMKFLYVPHSVIVRIYDHMYNQIARNCVYLKTLLCVLVYVIFKKVGESTSIYLHVQSLGPQLRRPIILQSLEHSELGAMNLLC